MNQGYNWTTEPIHRELWTETVNCILSPWSAFGSLILNCVIQRRFDKINVIFIVIEFSRSAICIYRLAKIMGFFDLWYDDSVIFFSSQVWVKAQLHVTWNIYIDKRSEWKYNDITHFLLLWITFLHDDLRGIASEHLNMLLECKCSLR